MMVVAGFFTLCAVLSLFLLKQVSGLELQSPCGSDICLWGYHLSSFGLGISVFLKMESEHSQNGAGGAFCVSAELLRLTGEQVAALGRGQEEQMLQQDVTLTIQRRWPASSQASPSSNSSSHTRSASVRRLCVHSLHLQADVFSLALFPRCIPCIGAQEPASKGLRKSFPKASSPTGASRTRRPGLPPQLHAMLSGAISPPQGPPLPRFPFHCRPNLHFLTMHFSWVPC